MSESFTKKNFKNIPIEGDIRNVKGQEFEADVITGGFPCQPFSVAGKQKGTDDNRYLWPEMFRLIKEIKPEFVIGENVQGLINLQDGMVLRQVQDQLEGEGFEVQCFLIPASGLGAWHQRNRVWIIGHSKHNGLLASEKRSRDKKINGGAQKGQNQTIESKRTNGSTNDGNVSNTIGSCQMDVVAPPETVKKNSSGWSVTRVGTGKKFPEPKLNDVVNKLWPTPRQRDYKDAAYQPTWKEARDQATILPRQVLKNNTPGGKLNPTFVEFLMGFPELDKDRSNRIKSLGKCNRSHNVQESLGLAVKKF